MASDQLENSIITRLIDGNGYLMSPDATYYVSLHTADPGDTGTNELPSTNGYARKSYTTSGGWNAASGGSTNAGLHLPALANEVGIKFDLMDVAKIFKKTPYLADLKPGGKYVARDMWLAGGVPMLLKTLYAVSYTHLTLPTILLV